MAFTAAGISDFDSEGDEGDLDRFFELYWSDVDQTGPRPLSHYLALYPDREAEVARAYLALEDAGSADAEIDDQERIGPYKLIRLLGQGGQAAVYLAEDTRLGRQVALKILQGNRHPTALQRFRREAEIVARLIEHPGICPIYEVGIESGIPFIAMAFIEGESLTNHYGLRAWTTPSSTSTGTGDSESSESEIDEDSKLRSDAPSTPSELESVLELFEAVARTLHTAHESGVVHRDIKPQNIVVRPNGEPVILDFGLAHTLLGEDDGITQSGDFCGTPAYMAPEQLVLNHSSIDRRSDIWSLGVTLYECLTMQRPFTAPTREGLYQAIMIQDPVPASTLNHQVSLDLRTVIETTLSKDRDHRYQTALDLAEDLRRVRLKEPILARRPSPLVSLILWARRQPALAASMGSTFGILVIGLFTTLVLLAQVQDREARARESGAKLITKQAETELLLAERAMSAGQWRLALESLSRAEALGHPKRERIALDRVEVLHADLRSRRAAAELRALDARQLTGLLLARYQFLAAEILSPTTAERRRLMATALATHGLGPADAAYAQAVMAETRAEATHLLDIALHQNPGHSMAMMARGTLMLLAGNPAASDAWIAQWRALRPSDPQLSIFRAFASAINGSENASQPLDALCDRFRPDDLTYLRELVEVVQMVGQLGRISVQNLKGTPVSVDAAELKKVIRQAKRLEESLDNENRDSLLQRPLPVLRREILTLAEGMLRENERFTSALQRFALRSLRRKLFGMAKAQPLGPESDAILYALRALRRMETKSDFKGAIADYEASMNRPSFLGPSIRQAAATGGLLPIAHQLLKAERQGESLDEATRGSLKEFLRQLSGSALDPDKLRIAAKLSVMTGDLDFARWWLATARLNNPSSPELMAAEAWLCEATGDFERGLRLLKSAYPKGPPSGHRDERLRQRLKASIASRDSGR